MTRTDYVFNCSAAVSSNCCGVPLRSWQLTTGAGAASHSIRGETTIFSNGRWRTSLQVLIRPPRTQPWDPIPEPSWQKMPSSMDRGALYHYLRDQQLPVDILMATIETSTCHMPNFKPAPRAPTLEETLKAMTPQQLEEFCRSALAKK